MALARGQTRGRYTLEQPLGRGGFAEVWSARDVDGHTAALKVLHAPATPSPAGPSAAERLREEARILARLDLPGVVRVHGVVDDTCYAMELVEGPSLDALEAPLAVTLALWADVAATLARLHGLGVVHRDVKASNVLTRAVEPARTVLIDFGIAKDLGGGAFIPSTADHRVVGSLRVVSPERLEPVPAKRRLVAQADQWSVGMALYEALAGRPAFAAPSLAALIHQIRVTPHAPLVLHERFRAPDRGIATELGAVIDRCLAKRPEDRFGDTGELAHALRALVDRASQPS